MCRAVFFFFIHSFIHRSQKRWTDAHFYTINDISVRKRTHCTIIQSKACFRACISSTRVGWGHIKELPCHSILISHWMTKLERPGSVTMTVNPTQPEERARECCRASDAHSPKQPTKGKLSHGLRDASICSWLVGALGGNESLLLMRLVIGLLLLN